MRYIASLTALIALGACTAPEIADWPPKAPPVDEAVVDDYVQRYTRDIVTPNYTAEDIDALILLNKRRYRNVDEESDLERYRRDLDENLAKSADDDVTAGPSRSRGEINAIERRFDRRYESRHDQRHERLKYGL